MQGELADMDERQLIQLDDGEYDEYGPKNIREEIRNLLDLPVSKPHIGEGVTTRSSSAIHPIDGNDRRILHQAPQQDPEEDLKW